ncbi:hypothetical protein [Acetobacterium sp. KB-1]|uniref:hypothetical protein n=1 Tax=Acetobacterium sp. KB-1 TaxID=2184575 RepID=UPI0019550AF8|nr:hypothetical protein [Acetobacterium sp. KB-1]
MALKASQNIHSKRVKKTSITPSIIAKAKYITSLLQQVLDDATRLIAEFRDAAFSLPEYQLLKLGVFDTLTKFKYTKNKA